jgi:S1-C subfamily serine protease
MNTPLLALVVTTIGGAARAAVVLPSDSGAAWKEVADKLHSTVIEVRAGASVSAGAAGGGQEVHETVTYGTGVLIGNGLAITTLHAVALPSATGNMIPLREVQVLVPDVGQMDARVVAGAPELDLAILALPEQASPLEGAPFATEPPAPGDTLLAMGTGDESITVLGVLVSAVSTDLFALTSKRMIDSRFWGGPLFDLRGRLAGVQLTSLGPSKAISARAIQRLLDQRGVNPGSPARH